MNKFTKLFDVSQGHNVGCSLIDHLTIHDQTWQMSTCKILSDTSSFCPPFQQPIKSSDPIIEDRRNQSHILQDGFPIIFHDFPHNHTTRRMPPNKTPNPVAICVPSCINCSIFIIQSDLRSIVVQRASTNSPVLDSLRYYKRETGLPPIPYSTFETLHHSITYLTRQYYE